ncbi:MAG: hypothetical protein E6X17_01095 [Sporomusaceae bacterium]|nr:hypothetical protein [Sporomusaceae bacterium]
MQYDRKELLQGVEAICAQVEKLLWEMRDMAEKASDNAVSDSVREQLQEAVVERIAAIDRLGSLLLKPLGRLDS